MDLVTQTSLEALLLKATNPQNQNVDTAAVEAFCTLVNKEKDGAHIGVKVIASKLPTGNEKEVLQTLNVLDICMIRCGSQFQGEVGKFRFLNEMIKLVSPKYLGSHTPLTVKQKVLQLLYVWTLDYPKEPKIKEAFDMLRKQGVIREIPNPNIAIETVNIPKRKPTNSIFQDEEKSKILQKLLQSKDPEDIQAANWLIKSMVKEDDKRTEMKSRTISEVESTLNNVRLLNEMLDSYKPGVSSQDELDLIKELQQSCLRLKPNIAKLASLDEGIKTDVDLLQATTELKEVLSKYHAIIVEGKLPSRTNRENNESLLHFESSENSLAEGATQSTESSKNNGCKSSTIDVLCDIFTNTNIPDSGDVLQPVSVLKSDKLEINEKDKERENKFKALEDLDVLSEHLLKENLQSVNFNKSQEKIPMNLLSKIAEFKQQNTQENSKSPYVDLSVLVKESKEDPKESSIPNKQSSYVDLTVLSNNDKLDVNDLNKTSNNNHDSMDDCLVDISDEKMLVACDEVVEETTPKKEMTMCDKDNQKKLEKTVKNRTDYNIKLNDIFVKLENIKPSTILPMTVLNEKNGISVTLHFAKDKPKENVYVFVVTTVSKNELPLSDYLLQAVVPKGCKLKLQPPSATDLPPFNPFLPPAAITQIMLIANPENVQMSLKFILSYVMDDETITEMGEVENLPMVV